MKVIVETGDFFRGGRILLEIDTRSQDHAEIEATLRIWKDWLKEATEPSRLELTPSWEDQVDHKRKERKENP